MSVVLKTNKQTNKQVFTGNQRKNIRETGQV